MKNISVTFSNGEIWYVDFDSILALRAKFIANTECKNDKDFVDIYERELHLGDYESEIIRDWVIDIIGWKDIHPYAKKISDPKPLNHAYDYNDAEIAIIET